MYRIAAIGYLLALFLFSAWRAATQSFTTDEAFSWQLYIGASPFSLFRVYDANLHLLHTLLVWASVKLWGLSEITFRLPSVAACAAYFAAVYRLCRAAFGAGAMFVLAVLLLTLNPLVLDHMAIGRGYGLALAFFAWAFGEALGQVRTPGDGRGLLPVAALLALSVASNLTFLFPAAALVAVLALWRVPGVANNLAGPAFVFAFLLVVMPFSRFEPGQFYFGSQTFTVMNQSLLEMSIGDRHLAPLWVNSFAAVLSVGSAAAALWLWRRGRSPVPPLHDGPPPAWASAPCAALATATFALTAVAVAGSHFAIGLPLPWARTGLYFLFLAPLCLLAAADSLRGWRRGAACAVLAAAAIAMAGGIRPDRFLEWRFDASTRDIVAQIRARQGASSAPVRIGSSPPIDRTLALYRDMYGLRWVSAIGKDPFAPGLDYYVLRDIDRKRAAGLGLREIYASKTSGTALAVPR